MKINWKQDIFSIPNILSICRLLMIPVYTLLYLRAETIHDYRLAAAVLALSCLTDFADGQIARRFHMITNLGKILDPVADKATQLTMVLCLAIRYPVLWGLLALLILKETFQLIAGLRMLRSGKMLCGALPMGKISTAVLFISLTMLVLLPELPQNWVQVTALVDYICLALAFYAYIRAYRHQRSDQFQTI